MEMGHIRDGKVRRDGKRREKEKGGSPVPAVDSASPRKEFLSQATDCPLNSLVYYV